MLGWRADAHWSLRVALAATAVAVVAGAAVASLTPPSRGPLEQIIVAPPSSADWRCRRSDGTACGRTDLADARFRQILVLSTGFTDSAGRAAFWRNFDVLVRLLASAGGAWTEQKKDQILYVGYYTGGGPLNTAGAALGGGYSKTSIRGGMLRASNAAIFSAVDALGGILPELDPLGVAVLFNNADDEIASSAAPPSFIGGSYGIAKLNQADLESASGVVHELGHAALNFLDEHPEPGFEEESIESLDLLTPELLFDGSWGGFVDAISDLFGVYDYNLSEILGDNGNDNVSTLSVPTTVPSGDSAPQNYEFEGGMFFGRGTWHEAADSVMSRNPFPRAGPNDSLPPHSASQQALIDVAFGEAPARANDRLRNAGPVDGWPTEGAGPVTLLLFDADKHHRFHPTEHYVVQVGWWERLWIRCGAASRPEICPHYIWLTMQKAVVPVERTVQLPAGANPELTDLLQRVLCSAGLSEVPGPDGAPMPLCDRPLSEMQPAFLPTFEFRVPYEAVALPAPRPHTTYWWRFATSNGTARSGWTGWSSFYRSL